MLFDGSIKIKLLLLIFVLNRDIRYGASQKHSSEHWDPKPKISDNPGFPGRMATSVAPKSFFSSVAKHFYTTPPIKVSYLSPEVHNTKNLKYKFKTIS